MDALGAYGSDTSDDDKSPIQAIGALSSLLGYDDDDDSNSDAKEEPPQKRLKQQAQQQHTAGNDPTSTKDITKSLLPPPHLGSDSIIESTVDYFTATYGSPHWKAAMPPKLEQLASAASGTTTNWAQQLKSQHEFHNPAFFETVIKHFGVQDKGASNLPLGSKEIFHDYELDLGRLEEEARMRQQQQQAPSIVIPTAYAQEQLERAMQTHTSRR